MKKKRRLNERGKRKRRRRIMKQIVRILIILLPIILICIIGSCARNRSEDTNDDKTKETILTINENEKKFEPKTASLISGGDIIMHGPFLKSSHYKKDDGTYDYDSIFQYVKDTYQSADYTILNLESTISEGDYTSYPMFRAPSDIVRAIASNGGDMCLLANNHIYDNFGDGLTMTLNALDENSLDYIGVRKSTSDNYYQIVDVNEIKIGIFNYTYETPMSGGQHTINAIPVSSTDIEIINTFNYDEIELFYNEITSGLQYMEEQNVDYTIVFLHWGEEYQTTENQRQRDIAQKLCDLGIDALIGGHPHVIQPVDLLTSATGEHKMVCVYSMGNHLANQHKGRIASSPNGHTEDGIMVRLTIDKDEDGIIALSDIQFVPTWTYRTVGVGDSQNPEFFIFPLDNPEDIVTRAKDLSNLDIQSQVTDSLERTNEIIGEGVTKIKQALPIVAF